MQKQIDQRFDVVDRSAASREEKTDAQFKTMVALLGELKAKNDLNTLQAISTLSERVAVLEARHQSSH